jgi:MFS family permease
VDAISLASRLFQSMPLNIYYLVGGAFIVLSAPLFLRLPKDIGSTEAKPARILLKRRYWLYYVLIFFAGARKLVVNSFVTLVLVQNYGLKVWQISTLMLISSVLNMLVAPYLGSLVDRLGERVTTPVSYVVLALSCIGFATINNVWFLIGFWMLNRLVAPLRMGLSTYVYRTAPPEELTPTLSAGVTFDHISSVGMPFLAGALVPVIEYEGVFLATAGLILLSIPFARALQVRLPSARQPVVSGAE